MFNSEAEIILKLFKGYKYEGEYIDVSNETVDERALTYGICIPKSCPEEIKALAIEMYGLNATALNNTFHKSFNTVVNTDKGILIIQQLLHYFTTYGIKEIFGNCDLETMYIPNERLNIPDFEGEVTLTVIRPITENEIHNKLMKLLNGVALSSQTVQDIIKLSDYIKQDIEDIKNREVKIAMYEKYNIVPENAVEFLRYLVYKLTNSTTLIRSREVIYALSNCNKLTALKLFNKYIENENGFYKLSQIYLRYKRYFVAIKSHNSNKTEEEKELNHIINRIRKIADENKEVYKLNILDRLTSIYDFYDDEFFMNVNANKKVDGLEDLLKIRIPSSLIILLLDDINIFREVRIYNALNFRVANKIGTSIVYKIRNGKEYVSNVGSLSLQKYNAQKELLDLVANHLFDRFKKVFDNKKVYLPENVRYVVPTTEKQFLGNFPFGTTIKLNRDSNLVIGIHWKNLINADGTEEQVDLDLHAYGDGKHYGWNGKYNSEDDIVFSGDLTNAPNPLGATELFRISKNIKGCSFMLKLKKYTLNKADIPFDLIVAKARDEEFSRDYVVNPNEVLLKLDLSTDCLSNKVGDLYNVDMNLAHIIVTEDGVLVVFDGYSSSKSICESDDDLIKKLIEYNDAVMKTKLDLNTVVENSNCIRVDSPNEADIDLSLEVITKDTLLGIFEE